MNHDGPELTLFYDGRNNDLYLFYWVDYSDESNTWLIFQVLPEMLRAYLNRSCTLKSLIESACGQHYLTAEIKRGFVFANTPISSLPALPLDYLPVEGIYFDTSLSPHLAKIYGFLNLSFSTTKVRAASLFQVLMLKYKFRILSEKKYLYDSLSYVNTNIFSKSNFELSMHSEKYILVKK
ncbi:MAG: hypothetical protein ACRCYO_06335 [Bacteroidia bacterium]